MYAKGFRVLLGLFNDGFIDYLFDLVEQTRHMQDESLNYSLIKLIVSLCPPPRNGRLISDLGRFK